MTHAVTFGASWGISCSGGPRDNPTPGVGNERVANMKIIEWSEWLVLGKSFAINAQSEPYSS